MIRCQLSAARALRKIFETHLKLPGYSSFAALDRAYAHSLSASQQRAVGARQQSSPWPGDRGFESISLQRGVPCELIFGSLLMIVRPRLDLVKSVGRPVSVRNRGDGDLTFLRTW